MFLSEAGTLTLSVSPTNGSNYDRKKFYSTGPKNHFFRGKIPFQKKVFRKNAEFATFVKKQFLTEWQVVAK